MYRQFNIQQLYVLPTQSVSQNINAPITQFRPTGTTKPRNSRKIFYAAFEDVFPLLLQIITPPDVTNFPIMAFLSQIL